METDVKLVKLVAFINKKLQWATGLRDGGEKARTYNEILDYIDLLQCDGEVSLTPHQELAEIAKNLSEAVEKYKTLLL